MPLCDIDDVYIDRQPGVIELLGVDGKILRRLPLSFTNDQARAALAFANAAYDRGIEEGKRLLQEQIKAALGIV